MSYILLLDTNVWVSERMLKSSIGDALLFVLAEDSARFCLPEIVEREVEAVLRQHAESAFSRIRSESSLLRQLTGHDLHIMAPSEKAIGDGIRRRWAELSGATLRVPFTFDCARKALDRVMEKKLPSGSNNEQYRDCCIWETAKDLARHSEVHLLTSDRAFFAGGNASAGLAASLREELDASSLPVVVSTSVSDLLTKSREARTQVDKELLSDLVIRATRPSAVSRATKDGRNRIEAEARCSLEGFSTPSTSLIAISFKVQFGMTVVARDGEPHPGSLTAVGACSYNPAEKAIVDVDVRGWSESIYDGSSHTTTTDRGFHADSIEPDMIRYIV